MRSFFVLFGAALAFSASTAFAQETQPSSAPAAPASSPDSAPNAHPAATRAAPLVPRGLDASPVVDVSGPYVYIEPQLLFLVFFLSDGLEGAVGYRVLGPRRLGSVGIELDIHDDLGGDTLGNSSTRRIGGDLSVRFFQPLSQEWEATTRLGVGVDHFTRTIAESGTEPPELGVYAEAGESIQHRISDHVALGFSTSILVGEKSGDPTFNMTMNPLFMAVEF